MPRLKELVRGRIEFNLNLASLTPKLGRQEVAVEDGSSMIFRIFQGHVVQSLGLSGWALGAQLEICPGQKSM